MIMKVLKKPLEYKNCPIVIRQAGDTFEFITCINNQIYSSRIEARISLINRLLLRSYSKEQLHKVTNYMIAMAQTTIDSVLNPVQPVVEKKVEDNKI